MELTANDISHAEIVKIVASTLNIDKRVVDVSCRHLFQFISECFRDTNNINPIRVRYLGIFAIRGGLKKK
jgi:hypothetical protein